jgi:hypothetical protein
MKDHSKVLAGTVLAVLALGSLVGLIVQFLGSSHP